MSRMYSDSRGTSGSTKPRNPATGWVGRDAGEVEDLVERLAGQELLPSEIGRKLRDLYGVPDVQALTGSKISQIFEKKEIQSEIPEDLYRLLERAVDISDHLDKNENDQDAKRRLSLVESKIRRLADYYRGDKIPEDWSYSLQRARLIVE